MELKNSTLDDLAAVVGFTAALRLSAWFGDLGNLYIPGQVEDGQLLVKLIGKSAAEKLSQEWGQQHISVPRLTGYEEDARKRLIGQLLTKGFTTREVSHMARLSERRVQQICRELETAGLIPVISPKKSPEKTGPQSSGIFPGISSGEK